MQRIAITLFLLLAFSPTVAANIVWPALYAETRVSSLPIIALSLLLEWLVIRWLFRMDWKRSAAYALAANLASGVLGLLFRPLLGIAWDLSLGQLVIFLFNWGTFNPIAWFFVPVIGGAVNASIELLTIRLIWKQAFTRKRFLVLWLANWLTVGMATIWVVASPPAF